MKKCSINGCERKHRSRGYCDAHLQRFYRSGDPAGSGKAVWGEGIQWLRNNSSYDGSGCLTWPFGKGGYPAVYFEGRKQWAHRVMCMLAHGAPPTPKHEAAHSCGRGKDGCVSPAHLRWATAVENSADKQVHGTSNRGSRNPMAKLNERQVDEIRAADGLHKDIARQYGVSRATIGEIKRGERWQVRADGRNTAD